MANPKPTYKLKPLYGNKPLSANTITLRLPVEIDEFVRSLPNRTQWLRQAIAKAYEEEMKANESRVLD